MIDEKKVKTATEVFLDRPWWKEMYDTSPSPTRKRHCELIFCFYCFISSKELSRELSTEINHLEENFTIDDWNHFREWCMKWNYESLVIKCDKNIQKLKSKQNPNG